MVVLITMLVKLFLNKLQRPFLDTPFDMFSLGSSSTNASIKCFLIGEGYDFLSSTSLDALASNGIKVPHT